MGEADVGGGSSWWEVHRVPVMGTVALVVLGMNFSLWWNPLANHETGFAGDLDLWRTYGSTLLLIHGHVGDIYGPRTGQIAFPGALVVLAPAVALGQALHLSVGYPVTAIQSPTAWIVVQPFQLALAGSALFACDAAAGRLGVGYGRRWALGALEVVCLWDVAVWYGHPEYPLAVAFALYGVLAAVDGHDLRAAWFLGIAIAFQPSVAATLGVLAALAAPRRWPAMALRVAVPVVAVTAAPLIASWSRTTWVLHNQPAPTTKNHPTPWVHLAPHLSSGVVAAGPVRLVGTVAGLAVAYLLCRRRPPLETVVLVVAAVLALRAVVEPVEVAYYVWPAIAVGLVAAAAAGRARLAGAGAFAVASTVYAKSGPSGEWRWYVVVVGTMLAVLVAAWRPLRPGPSRTAPAGPAGPAHEPAGGLP